MLRRKAKMFDFRIIDTSDGNQIIDRQLKTSCNSLTPLEMLEYTEMDNHLYFMDKLKEKARKESERQRKLARNPLWKLACHYKTAIALYSP